MKPKKNVIAALAEIIDHNSDAICGLRTPFCGDDRRPIGSPSADR